MKDYLHRFDSWTITYSETMCAEPRTMGDVVYHTVTAYSAETAFDELAKLIEKGDEINIKAIEIYNKDIDATFSYDI